LALPTIAITTYNMHDPKRREIYNDLSEYEKEFNDIVISDDAYKDEN